MLKKNNTIHSKKKPADYGLKQLQKDFLSWRKSRSHHKEAIPELLWKRAIELLKYYSLGKISSSLNLNHQKLRIKAQNNNIIPQSTYKKKTKTSSITNFIEIDMSGKSDSKNCLIELENARNEHFKIHANYKTILEHIDFINSFLKK
jgi:hypothetical protein